MQHLEWKGSKSQRFSPGKRIIPIQHELGPGLQSNHYPRLQGLKTFNQSPTPQILYKPHLKTFAEKYSAQTKQIDLRGKKPLDAPHPIDRKRPQLRHVQGGNQTTNQIRVKSFRTFQTANRPSQKQFQLESKLQKKARILGLQGQRNYIGVSSLGDKPYKYPEYAPDFYKQGGLIPGATINNRSQKQQLTLDEKKLKTIFTKPHWHVKVKMQQTAEQKKIVDSVDEWEQTILKENNPKWKDPDAQHETTAASNNVTTNNNKKPAKK